MTDPRQSELVDAHEPFTYCETCQKSIQLGHWAAHTASVAHERQSYRNDLALVEQRAVAAERQRLAEAVRGLRGYIDTHGGFTRLVADPDGWYLEWPAVLALLEDKP